MEGKSTDAKKPAASEARTREARGAVAPMSPSQRRIGSRAVGCSSHTCRSTAGQVAEFRKAVTVVEARSCSVSTESISWAFAQLSLALWLVPSPPPEQQRLVPEQLVQRFRSIADLTFPIYVLHFPLLVLSSLAATTLGLFEMSVVLVFLSWFADRYLNEQLPRWKVRRAAMPENTA